MIKVDLNCDMGESYGRYNLGLDSEVAKYISSANIACGYHAGDPVTMEKTVKIMKENGVAVGAHPGFPDLLGFGRRNMAVTPDEARAYVQYQAGALMAFCMSNGLPLQHIKPHGALYNMAGKDYELSSAICKGIKLVSEDIILMGLSGSQTMKAAQDCGVKFACEVFADRAYEDDGSLVARSKPGAVIKDEDEAIERVIKMVLHHKVTSINGKEIEITPHSVCVHGDNEKALMFVQKIHKALNENGVEIAPLSKIV